MTIPPIANGAQWLDMSAPGFHLVGDVEQQLEAALTAEGSGELRSLEPGVILIALAYDSPILADGREIAGKLFTLIPRTREDLLRVPDGAVGRIRVEFRRSTRTASIVSQGQVLFRLSMDSAAQPVGDPVPLLDNAIQLSTVEIETELITSLDPLLGNEGTSGLTGDVRVPGWIATVLDHFTLQEVGGGGPDLCTNTLSGGPGSTGCSIATCPATPGSCSVTCGTGFYACCLCHPNLSYASCRCCRN